jgi:hypothetical protein
MRRYYDFIQHLAENHDIATMFCGMDFDSRRYLIGKFLEAESSEYVGSEVSAEHAESDDAAE